MRILLAITALTLTACGTAQPIASSGYSLVQSGVLTAGTQSEQPPFAMADKAGNPTGFAVDLMNEAAGRIGLKVQYKTTNLQGILAGLSAGQYDVGVAGVGVTEERRKNVDFTRPYYWGYTAVVTLKESPGQKLADFTGKRVGVVSGAVQEKFVDERMAGTEKVKFKDQTAMIGQLLSKGVDAIVLGGADAEEYVARQPVRIAAQQDSTQGSAFPLRKGGDPKLHAALDNQIDAMIDDGTYVRLYRKYFKAPIAADLLKERPRLADKIRGTDLAPTGR
ncbi:polar amino acid transport system substrate-binding protein [Kibdelosporangium banguiense]|uniref:Polar amino acid transport system substrate-binding protein n=1 Tax=Kibdelosporangium banguiense TaxID=1365924 RepID=A0ABS4TKM6_9PSEU|nr:ABC transporter substrate-binding protein [Kibdelosporangium banguiense]MBP2324976.1 polar amino acid transport system substrate-binding protein [Kibdelosporangium banguiense]